MQRRTFLLGMAAAGAGCTQAAQVAESDSDRRARVWQERVAEIWRQRQQPLSEHRIAEIRTFRTQAHYPRLVGRNSSKGIHGHGPAINACILRTDQGAMGWGHGSADEKLLEAARERLVGKPVGDFIDLSVGVTDPDLRFLDIALHDLAGVIRNEPVNRMLHTTRPSGSILFNCAPCYSGMIYMDDLDPEDNPAGIDKVLENCAADHSYGYRQLKLKIGRGNKWMEPEAGLARDIEVTRRVAEAFPDCKILVDGNNGFTVDMFLRYMEGIGDVSLYWIEEPFHENRDDLKRLHDWMKANGKEMRVAEGEAGFDKDQLMALAEEDLVHVFIPDILGYGFTPWRGLLGELHAKGFLASPHTWGSPLKTYYAAQLCNVGELFNVEGVTGTVDGVDTSGYTLKDGSLCLPDAPGFGLKLEEG